MKRTFIAIFFSVIGAVGCGGTSTDADTANSEQAIDSTSVGANESAIMATAADVTSTSGPTSALAAATVAAANLPTRFTPAGCATVTQAGDIVTIVATNCTGPYGLVAVTGTINITYGYANGSVTIQTAASNLKVNRATMDLSASGTQATANNQTTLTITTMSSGTGPLGQTISRAGSYTVVWGNMCMTISGMWSTTVDSVKWSTAVSNFRQCADMCPSAGGSLVFAGAAGRSITITYPGSSFANYSIEPSGKTGEITLFCSAS